MSNDKKEFMNYETNVFILTGDVEDKTIEIGGQSTRINSFRLLEKNEAGKQYGFIKVKQTPKKRAQNEDGTWSNQQIWEKSKEISIKFEIGEYGTWKSVEEYNQFLDGLMKTGTNGKFGKVMVVAKKEDWYNKDTKKGGEEVRALAVYNFFSEAASMRLKAIAESLMKTADAMKPTHHERDAKTGAPVNTESQKAMQNDDDLPF